MQRPHLSGKRIKVSLFADGGEQNSYLEDVDIVLGQPKLEQDSWNGIDWCNAHILWLNSCIKNTSVKLINGIKTSYQRR